MSAALRRIAKHLCTVSHSGQRWPSKKLYGDTVQPACSGLFRVASGGPGRPVKSAKKQYKSLNAQFADAARANDVDELRYLWWCYRQSGKPLPVWLFDSQISVHARRGELGQALHVFKSIIAEGLKPSSSSYNELLHAYAQAGHPPYKLNPAVALKAQAVFDDMVAAGHKPSRHGFHWLLATQANAALVDNAVSTYALMLRYGYAADTYTVSIMVDAYARSNQTLKAQECFDTMIAEHNITPSVASWNTLLGAYAEHGLMDGAYAVWQKMVALKVVPNAITQRVLATAFGGNPHMAASIVQEAQKLQILPPQKSLPADPSPTSHCWHAQLHLFTRDAGTADPKAATAERLSLPGNKYQQHNWQMQVMQGDVGSRGPFVLDLHGLSRPAARLALQNRLQYLAGKPELLRDQSTSEPALEIIVGQGRNSFSRSSADSMKTTVQHQLRQLQITFEPGSNPGRVQIPYGALLQHVQQEQRSLTTSAFLHEASLRYLMVFGGVSGVLAATYVIPKLLTEM